MGGLAQLAVRKRRPTGCDECAASAFHCYGGTPAQMTGVSPPPVVTECTGTDDGFPGTFRWDARNLVVGAIDAGSTGLMMWNLALDQDHGPRLGGCSNCRGVVDVDSRTGSITRQPEFYTLAHLARAADPGASVVESADVSGTPYVAFLNPDGAIGIFGHNDTGTPQVYSVAYGDGAAETRIQVGPGELFSLRGPASGAVANLVTPTVAGSAQVGQTLTASTGVWSPSDAAVTQQWLRSGVPIPGATDTTYALRAADLGERITVVVRAVSPGLQSGETTSEPTTAVRAGSVGVTARGAVRGRWRAGARLRVTGLHSVPATQVTYQWLRNGVAVRSAAARRAAYVVRRADRGKRLSVRLTLHAPGYEPRTVALRGHRVARR